MNDKDNYGDTALILATSLSNTESNVETVKLLIDNGADVNIRGNDGWTALMYATCNFQNSNIETAKLLLDSGADIQITNDNDETILDRLLENEEVYENMINLLLNCMK